jgi:hypothetical protein
MESAVISVRLEKGVKERLEKEGVDVSYEFKKYVQRRIALLELKKTVKELTVIIKKNVKPSEKGFAVRSVREDRDAGH